MNRASHTSTRVLAGIAINAVFAFTGAAIASAQTAADSRWQPWIGCWQPSETSTTPQSRLACVIPAPGRSAVDIVSIENGKEIQRDRITADGERRSVSKDGCTGWESAEWSTDGRRVYVKSELTCANGLRRTSGALMAISAEGEWLAVENVVAGGASGLQVARYRDAGRPAGVPADITSALAGRTIELSAARLAAGADVGSSEIVEAVGKVDPVVVQGWLVERGQRFDISAKQLVSLAAAGVPGNVTDVMVALAYPDKFTINPSASDDAVARAIALRRGNRAPIYGALVPSYGLRYDPFYSRFGYPFYSYSPYGYYSPYGAGSAYGFGTGWYYGRSPFVIVGSGRSAPRGQAINESGYLSRGSGVSGRTARPRTSTSLGIGATRSTSGSRSTGRTATRRH